LALTRTHLWIALGALVPAQGWAHAATATVTVVRQQVGSIRGVVFDKDFALPLAGATITIVETRQYATTGSQGDFVISQVQPGRYTLVFSKDGYTRQVRADVLVSAGQLTDVDVQLAGEFTDLDELVVQDIADVGEGTELSLLQLRFESPALMDSISSELMSRAGASDAASALRLVSGASVQDGKYAVVRGLPDRYVSSQLNGVRLPTADEDKRAVELDQFPSAVIESLRVSKTFTPDQQGDASGGAVDVRLKGIPDEPLLQFKAQYSHNSQSPGGDEFLTYDGGGVGTWGNDGGNSIQTDNLGQSWDGAVGVSEDDAPIDTKLSLSWGDKTDIGKGWTLGGFLNAFYERDSSYYDDGVDNSFWVRNPGEQLTPQTNQGTPEDGDFKTALFDVEQGSQSVQWGLLGTLGVASKNHKLALTYLYSHSAEDTATRAEDTRGKEHFFPGYDRDDISDPGNSPENRNAAPYLRLETLEYTERSTSSLQFHGEHTLPVAPFEVLGLAAAAPELDWTFSINDASLHQPDKRQFGALWLPPTLNPGFPPFIPPFTQPAVWLPYKPAANFNLGNVQRIWKDIEEESEQVAVNLKLPFETPSKEQGYFKLGVFDDHVQRKFSQETFSNFGDAGASFQGDWEDSWSAVFPFEDHPITGAETDVDYEGEIQLSAWYGMLDYPLTKSLNLIGGARVESTEIGIVNLPEDLALWYPPGASAPVDLNPGDADVEFEQDDVLPSVGLEYTPFEGVTLRAAYSETVARQTFKELTPIIQQEFLGGPVFIGNPELRMSALKNYDLRADFVPHDGALISASWFTKSITDPIEYVQRAAAFGFTTPVNYPEGELSGFEIEARERLDRWSKALEGFSLGLNATFIQSEVTLPDDEAAAFASPSVLVPITTRDMTNAPEHLYNLYLTYDSPRSGTEVSLFYTVQGDTLVAGAGLAAGNFVPDVYALEYDTLNLSVTQDLGSYFKLHFQAKNLTNPEIEEVYRSDVTDGDTTKTSYTKGIEFSIGLTATLSF